MQAIAPLWLSMGGPPGHLCGWRKPGKGGAGRGVVPGAGYTAADYAAHIRTEHSTFRWLLEPMLAAAGLDIAEVSYDRRLYAAYTCVKAG